MIALRDDREVSFREFSRVDSGTRTLALRLNTGPSRSCGPKAVEGIPGPLVRYARRIPGAELTVIIEHRSRSHTVPAAEGVPPPATTVSTHFGRRSRSAKPLINLHIPTEPPALGDSPVRRIQVDMNPTSKPAASPDRPPRRQRTTSR